MVTQTTMGQPASGETPPIGPTAERRAAFWKRAFAACSESKAELERELRKLQMEMPDYKQCCELREKAERELAEAQSATPASEETGTVVCTVEFVQAAKEMAEAVRWVIQDAAYKPPEEIGYIPQRWIDRLRGVERVADEKLNASTDESSKT